MSLYTQTCGVVVLAVLLALFLINRSKLFLHTERLFIAILVTSLMANITDIACQFMLHDKAFSYTITRVTCEVYQILIILVLCLTMLYISKDVYGDNKTFLKKTWYYIALFVASAATIFILPEELSREEGKLYAYGQSVDVSYVLAALFIFAVLIRVNVMREHMNSDRRTAINLWMGIWMLVAILESTFPHIFMAGFATSIGVMIVYIKLENPGMNLDRESGLHSQNAFVEYVQQMYNNEKTFSFVVVVPHSYNGNIGDQSLNMKRASEIFKAKDAIIFRKAEDEIALVFDTKEDALKWQEDFGEVLKCFEETDIKAILAGAMIYVENSGWFKDSEELMYFIKYAVTSKYVIEGKSGRFVEVNEEMINDMREEKKIEKMLDKALKEKRVEVFYQPIYSTEKGKFTTAEALVRIREKDGKIVPPGVFIPVAEKTGKIIELGNEVFRQVCQLIKNDDIGQYGIEYIEVNLSVAQCGDRNLAGNYIATMEEHSINPKNINLEITESVSMKSKEILLDNMNRLIDYGVNFSLDDFGTGQSNLNYIVDMPVDIVKFDRGMITSYFDNKKAKYVMDAAMHMIHGMGLKIVSEGIETREQFGKMAELGIAYIQGFYFSKPLERTDFIKFLVENNGQKISET